MHVILLYTYQTASHTFGVVLCGMRPPFLRQHLPAPMAPLGQNTRLAASTHGHVFNLSDLGNCGVELWNYDELCGSDRNMGPQMSAK